MNEVARSESAALSPGLRDRLPYYVCTAEVLFGLARVLADRQYAPA